MFPSGMWALRSAFAWPAHKTPFGPQPLAKPPLSCLHCTVKIIVYVFDDSAKGMIFDIESGHLLMIDTDGAVVRYDLCVRAPSRLIS